MLSEILELSNTDGMWSEVLELTLTGCGDTGINTDGMWSEMLELTLTGCGVRYWN